MGGACRTAEQLRRRDEPAKLSRPPLLPSVTQKLDCLSDTSYSPHHHILLLNDARSKCDLAASYCRGDYGEGARPISVSLLYFSPLGNTISARNPRVFDASLAGFVLTVTATPGFSRLAFIP